LPYLTETRAAVGKAIAVKLLPSRKATDIVGRLARNHGMAVGISDAAPLLRAVAILHLVLMFEQSILAPYERPLLLAV
jgi:hypothetical protein